MSTPSATAGAETAASTNRAAAGGGNEDCEGVFLRRHLLDTFVGASESKTADESRFPLRSSTFFISTASANSAAVVDGRTPGVIVDFETQEAQNSSADVDATAL